MVGAAASPRPRPAAAAATSAQETQPQGTERGTQVSTGPSGTEHVEEEGGLGAAHAAKAAASSFPQALGRGQVTEHAHRLHHAEPIRAWERSSPGLANRKRLTLCVGGGAILLVPPLAV